MNTCVLVCDHHGSVQQQRLNANLEKGAGGLFKELVKKEGLWYEIETTSTELKKTVKEVCI